MRQKTIQLRAFPDEDVARAATSVAAMLSAAGFAADLSERAAAWFRTRGTAAEPDAELRTAILYASADSQMWLSTFGFAGPYWWLPKEMRLVVDLARVAGPALRKIVPATLRLIQIRKRPNGVSASGPNSGS